jgi:hypothetical protein
VHQERVDTLEELTEVDTQNMSINEWIAELKDRKRRLEGGEWEPQISFNIFGLCPKIKPQETNTNTLMTMTLEKGGCSLRT